MKHFDYITAAKELLTPQTTTLLSAIHEAKVVKAYRLQSG